MNVCFNMANPLLKEDFSSHCEECGLTGLKGYSTDFRASLYNALPMESVEKLVEGMQEFEHLINFAGCEQ